MKRVLVIGDTILDRYVYGSVNRVSPEAPTLVLDWNHEEMVPGGACNVATNILTLSDGEFSVEYVGYVDNRVLNSMEEFGFKLGTVRYRHYHQILEKIRYVSGKHYLLRVDIGKSYPPYESISGINLGEYDLIVISDYDKGTVNNENLIREILESGVPIIFDLKCYRPWLNGLPTDNCIFKCNKKEYSENGIGDNLWDFLGSASMIVTKGESGFAVVRKSSLAKHYPAIELGKIVPDVVGAGDVFTAGMAAAFMEHGEFDAARLGKYGNVCAAAKVKKFGTSCVRKDEVAE